MAEPAHQPSTPLPILESQEQARLELWLDIARVTHLLERRVIACLGRAGLTLPQFDVLATLRFSAGVTQQELAQRLLVTKGNVCGLLDRLHRQGWVQRRPDPADARVNRLHLTEAGRTTVDEILPMHHALIARMLEPLAAEDVRRMRDGLRTVEHALHNEPLKSDGELQCP